MKSEGQTTILFKESIMGIEDIKITYNNTGASGFTPMNFGTTWASSNTGGMIIYYAFIINDTNKWFCEKPIAAEA